MRGHGEGTEPKPHPKGGFYSQISLGGKRKTIYGKTAAEVTRKKRELVRRFEDGAPLTDSRIKVSTWVQTWQDVKLPASGIKVSSQDSYKRTARVWVTPSLGDKALKDVLPSDCEAILLAMKAAGLSRNYRRLAHSVLTSMFGAAVREGKIKASPMASVDRPSPGRSRAIALTGEQVAALVAVLARTPTLVDLVPFMALTGTRRGEALGVCWDDVDEDKGVVYLRRQITRTSDGLGFSSLKTEDEEDEEADDRYVDLTPALARVLRNRRKRQMRDRMAAPVGTWAEDHDLIFTTMLGGMIEPNNVNRAFRQAVKRAGLPTTGKGKVTPHTLRHTHITMLLDAGEDPKTVAEMVGHSSTRQTTQVYQHVRETRRSAAAHTLGEALGL